MPKTSKQVLREYFVRGRVEYKATFIVEAESVEAAREQVERGDWSHVDHDDLVDWEATNIVELNE